MIHLTSILLAMAYILGDAQGETTSPALISDPKVWPNGFKMMINLQLLANVKGGWTMTLRFSKSAPNLAIWRAKIVDYSSDRRVYNLTDMGWNKDFLKCSVYDAAFTAEKDPGTDAPTATIEFHRKTGDIKLDPYACTTRPSTTEPRIAKEETAIPILVSKPGDWPSGFRMMIQFQLLDNVRGGWTMTLTFSKAAPGLQIWRAVVVSVSKDKKIYTLENMPTNRDLNKCFVFKAAFIANKTPGTKAPTAFVEFHRKKIGNLKLDTCPTLPPSQ